jgi:hypothetical protein
MSRRLVMLWGAFERLRGREFWAGVALGSKGGRERFVGACDCWGREIFSITPEHPRKGRVVYAE